MVHFVDGSSGHLESEMVDWRVDSPADCCVEWVDGEVDIVDHNILRVVVVVVAVAYSYYIYYHFAREGLDGIHLHGRYIVVHCSVQTDWHSASDSRGHGDSSDSMVGRGLN